MPDRPAQPASHEPPELPQGLSRDLDRLFGTAAAGVEVPPAIDRHIRRAAANRLRPTLPWRLVGTTGAVAAALALAVVAFQFFVRTPRAAVNELAAARSPVRAGDIDNSGGVDILDAFVLARAIDAHARGEAGLLADAWDITGDGTIDRADIDAVALAAVRLEDDDPTEPRGGAG